MTRRLAWALAGIGVLALAAGVYVGNREQSAKPPAIASPPVTDSAGASSAHGGALAGRDNKAAVDPWTATSSPDRNRTSDAAQPPAAGASPGPEATAGASAATAPLPDAQQAAATLFAVDLPDELGKPQKLSQWRGKVLIVNFWATWCVPCREEMPAFVRIQRDLGPKGLQFVGIAVDQQNKVVPFLHEIGVNYPALIGGYDAMELSRKLGNRVMALPFTVIVDRSGKIAHTHLGPLKPDALTGMLTQLL